MISLDDEPGTRLPTAAKSREDMEPDIPGAKRLLERLGQVGLSAMLFGEESNA